MFKQTLLLSALVLLPQTVMAKCEGMSVKEFSPSKFTIYHTDKGHKLTPVVFTQDEGDISDSEFLYQVSHKKNHDKKCSVVALDAKKGFTLKQKEQLIVKSAEIVGNTFVMNLNHASLKSIECTGVQTMGDIRDVVDPYLTFECRDKFAYQKMKVEGVAARLPASTK